MSSTVIEKNTNNNSGNNHLSINNGSKNRKHHLNDGTNLSLINIEFINVDEKYISCSQCVDKYQPNLNDIGWNINYVQSSNSLYINKQ